MKTWYIYRNLPLLVKWILVVLIVRVETGILDELNAACYQLQRVQGDQPHLLAKTLSIVFRQIWLLISLRSPTIWKSINFCLRFCDLEGTPAKVLLFTSVGLLHFIARYLAQNIYLPTSFFRDYFYFLPSVMWTALGSLRQPQRSLYLLGIS